jgi:hypothetical protein
MAEGFVVVSVASNGVIHAWGDKDGSPFARRSEAKNLYARMRRYNERPDVVEDHAFSHPGVTVSHHVRRILGWDDGQSVPTDPDTW